MKTSFHHHHHHHHALTLTLLWLWAALHPQLTPHVTGYRDTGYTSDCPPAVDEVMEGPVMRVHWTVEGQAPVGCPLYKTWIVKVPPSHGVFVYVQYMHLLGSEHFVRLDRMSQHDYSVWEENVHIWREKDYSVRMKSVIGVVKLHAMVQKPWIDSSSAFNITFQVYPESSLPKELPPPENSYKQPLFNCSQTRPIPEAIACDGIPHCTDQEDEAGCDYRRQGCDGVWDGWMPYRDHCLKVFHNLEPPYECGYADSDLIGIPFASLPDEEGVALAADMLYKAGLSFGVVDLHKVKPASSKHGNLYRFVWQWGAKGSPIAYQETEQLKSGSGFDCALLALFPNVHLLPYSCYLAGLDRSTGYVCMVPKRNVSRPERKRRMIVHLPAAGETKRMWFTKRCIDGSLVQPFHQCAWQGHVLSSDWSPHSFTLFPCGCGPPVHYSLLCDGLHDCEDGSDEKGCPDPDSVGKSGSVYLCRNLQTYLQQFQCDGLAHCLDGTDEELCTTCKESKCQGVGCIPFSDAQYFNNCDSPKEAKSAASSPVPGSWTMIRSVQLDGYGMSRIEEVPYAHPGYFECSNGLHIPTFLLNNLELDCPQGEDENIPSEAFTCPGFYRCQYTGQCLHPDLVCDGVPHCPNRDDERFCHLSHPSDCTCEGFACSCRRVPSPLNDVWYLRYLDLSGVKDPEISELNVLDFLQFLNASFCELSIVYLRNMPQLKVLDVSYNQLFSLSALTIENFPGLTHLNISGNALFYLWGAFFPNFISEAGFSQLQQLVMADTGLHRLQSFTLSSLKQLTSLDISGNRLKDYDSNIFWGLRSLRVLYVDDSRLCCSYFHTSITECHAPVDELSSCNDLLRLDTFRVLLWGFSMLTILGNCSVLVYRFVTTELKKITSFYVLVCHLCVADLLMGVYMMIIGVADAHFRGHYVAQETQWRQSKACLAAGFLAFVSSEVSAFMVCLITLDRMLRLCFPFRPRLHLSAMSYFKLGCLAWAVGILLATGPLLLQLEFYGESSLCLPLPITRHQFSGQTYAFLVFIVLNFLLFLFIGIGQLSICYSLRKSKAAVKSKRQEEDSAVARRLFLVVFTDFCCWFPVGLMGMLAFCGLPIPGEVTVWVAVFVLPVNSALNPFLYTLNALREKWIKNALERKSKKILLNLRAEFPKLSAEVADELIAMYVRSHRGVSLKKSLELFSSMDGESRTDTGTGTGTGTQNM